MDEAERCSRVALMFEGGIVVCDTPEEIRGLVPGHLLALRPSQLRQARQLLGGKPGILEVQTFGDLLHVFVSDVKAGRQTVEETLDQAGIAIEGLRETRPRMEEAFISLIKQQLQEEVDEMTVPTHPDYDQRGQDDE
jgi:ABC-2 type transport system ATP-binding protein